MSSKVNSSVDGQRGVGYAEKRAIHKILFSFYSLGIPLTVQFSNFNLMSENLSRTWKEYQENSSYSSPVNTYRSGQSSPCMELNPIQMVEV